MSLESELTAIRQILEHPSDVQTLDVALETVSKAVAAFPDSRELYELLGLLRYMCSLYSLEAWPHPDEVETELRKAIEIDLRSYESYLWFAKVLTFACKYEASDLALSKAMEFAGNKAYCYHEIAQLLRNGERVVEAYQKAVALEPEEYRWRFHLRLAYESLGRYEEALNAWQASVSSSGDDLTYQTYLADAYVMNGDIDEASRLCDEVYQKILSLDYARLWEDRLDVMEQHHVSLLVTACMTQALVFKSKGETNQAIAKFQEALALVSDAPEARCEIALILSEAGRQGDAMTQMSIARYHHALREYYTCGFSERINSTEGIRWILEYMRWPSLVNCDSCLPLPNAVSPEGAPISVEAEMEFIRQTLESDPIALEIDAARNAIATSPNSFEVYALLARWLYIEIENRGNKQPNYNEVIDAAQKAIALNSKYYDSYRWLARSLYRDHRYQETEQALSIALNLAGDQAFRYHEIGNLYRLLEIAATSLHNLHSRRYAFHEEENLIKAHQKAVELEPQNEEWRRDLRELYERCGRYEEALNVQRASMIVAGAEMAHKAGLAHSLMMNGNLEEAERLCKDVYQTIMALDYVMKPGEEISPDLNALISVAMTQARILKKQGDLDKAIEKFHEALAFASWNPEARCQIALIFWERGERDRARKELQFVRNNFLYLYFSNSLGLIELDITSAQDITNLFQQLKWPLSRG
ncbi:hypothetical protein CCAX7_45310 [Capsulimonas corticalis]|uniref:Uncharacterized protein n=1 Tax=Capsulimonas corticalis TaxID=2219043 RepID=A0A402D6F8_9BACT|nr:tetratricopeptide repeat protein [Capsulimonas corticalis]BDI32480.1 hypothetical protein CCAX7_45310 [Capsulimonas corticalis]